MTQTRIDAKYFLFRFLIFDFRKKIKLRALYGLATAGSSCAGKNQTKIESISKWTDCLDREPMRVWNICKKDALASKVRCWKGRWDGVEVDAREKGGR